MEEELNVLLIKIKSRKAGHDEVHPEVWKIRKVDDKFLQLCNAVHKQNTIANWTKDCIFFTKKCDFGITKNYKGIKIITITTKVYNVLLLNRMKPETEKILRKNQNGYRRNRPKLLKILSIHRIIKGVNAKKESRGNTILHRFLLGF